jgi:predicted alpha/beta-hydrolase family hydrolase
MTTCGKRLNTFRELIVSLDAGISIPAVVYEPSGIDVGATLILAHGAGAGQRSPFMTSFAKALAAQGLDTVTFDFPYIEAHRRLPDRRPILESCYRKVIDTIQRSVPNPFLFIGGKSMGGRIATHVAAMNPEEPIHGVVLLGYPLHPPGRPDDRRDAHLSSVGRPMLFVQGNRDTFGSPAELAPILAALSPPSTLHEVANGDHSFKVGRLRAAEQAAIYDEIQRTIAEWIRQTTDRLRDAR